MNQIIDDITKEYLRKDLPEIKPGDTIKVFIKIIEGGKERVQGFEGNVIKIQGGGISKSITVRRVFQGVGVERVFPLHSPRITKIEIKRKGDVRRAKLYYLRERSGKSARIKEQKKTKIKEN